MKKKVDLKLIFNIATLLIPFGMIIYFFVSENGLMDFLENASNFNWFWIIVAVACQLLNVFIDAYVLYRFTNNYNKTYTLRKSLKTTAVGQFFSVITPGAIGGQPAQIYSMKNQNIDTGIATSSLVQKFLVYQTTITIYSFIAMLCNLDIFAGRFGKTMMSLSLFGFISHAGVVIFIFMFSINKKLTTGIINWCFKLLAKIKIIKNPTESSEKIKSQLEYFHESNIKLYKNKKMLFLTCFLTIVQLTLIFSIPYTIYRAFGFNEAHIFDMITGQAFVTMISSFVPIPGGSGAAEGCFGLFFSTYFLQNTMKSAILVWRIISYYMNIIIFAPFSRIKNIRKVECKPENNKIERNK